MLKTGDRWYRRVLAESPMQTLTPYFGQTVQFPLDHVPAGQEGQRDRADGADLGAGARPRPAAHDGLAREPGDRRLRRHADQTAQTDINDLARYKCYYRTARLTYTATLVTTPVPPKTAK